MIVKMTKLQKACVDYAKRFKTWDGTCISKDSFLAGFNFRSEPNSQEVVDVEYNEGEHQLVFNQSTIQKFKDIIKAEFNIKELRIHTSENGDISFQGIIKDSYNSQLLD